MPKNMDVIGRFAQKYEVDHETGCFNWTGAKNRLGYGNWALMGRYWAAHRAVWEWTVGPVEDGLELDHLCRNVACINPDHLEPVTHQVNIKRSPKYAKGN
jgi:hypothetical protein